jgi:hypothetical protein
MTWAVNVPIVLMGLALLRRPGVWQGTPGDWLVGGALVLTLTAYVWAGQRSAWASVDEITAVQGPGLRWGVIIGIVWAARLSCEQLAPAAEAMSSSLGVLSWAVMLYAYARVGMAAAGATGQTRQGALAGVWSGMVSALIAFSYALLLGLAITGTLVPRPDVSAPMEALAAPTLRAILASGLLTLIVLGPALGAAFGALGGWLGRRRS